MFANPGWIGANPLEILITRACEPSLPEPNYALHLEVGDYIKQKKANTPREAATLVVRLVNHRNPHVGMLALSLLDTLVQSCGYPFHLQISTKEFLNELVRRFPERPPPFPGPVMQRILDLIHGWKEGICTNSRWKEDLGNIRDMHRLLSLKGYRFRDTPRHQSAPTENLKSAEELEDEDRAAQSAKLQELIRRGTPRDLAAAQELMKSLAGANPDAKPDYRQQALTELNKLEAKVILMNEMLDNFDVARSERFAAGDAYDQVATILTSARPKIQKWISDAETDDPESLDTFLQINDQINTVLNRYEAFKRGDYAAARNPIPSEFAQSQAAATSLIDFDDTPAPTTTSPPPGAADDFLSLFSSAPSPQANGRAATPVGTLGSIALPNSPGSTVPSFQQQQSYSPPTAQPQPQGMGMQTALGNMGFFGGGPAGGVQQQQPVRRWNPAQTQPAPQSTYQQQSLQQPLFQQQPFQQATTWPQQAGTPQTGTPQSGSAFGQTTQTQAPQQPAGQKDPFADLAGLF